MSGNSKEINKEVPFSVSICVYGKDNPVWFQTALDSVINQTLKPNQIVLVVDGPVPASIDNVICREASFCQRYQIDFNIIRLSENKGHGIARRTGIDNCSNDWIALMDADDISLPDRFEKQLSYIRNHSVDIIGGNIEEFIDTVDNITGRRIVPEGHDEILHYMKARCPFNQVTVMFRKEAVINAGGYIDWYCDEDYYLWLRMALNHCKMANVADILVKVRIGEDMYMRRGGLAYFKSEAKLQRFMLDKKLINPLQYSINVLKRLIVQVILPNRLRGLVFQKFARS